jgi:predicted transcriptional regulator
VNDPYSGKARVSFKCSEEMATLLKASAAYEHRSESQICRLALASYFHEQGYFEPENIARLAGAETGESE